MAVAADSAQGRINTTPPPYQWRQAVRLNHKAAHKRKDTRGATHLAHADDVEGLSATLESEGKSNRV